MNTEKLIEEFVRNFILKDKKDRSLFELNHPQKRNKFTDRLNHSYDKVLDIEKLTLIPRNEAQYDFIKIRLKIKDTDMCYAISNYEDLDGRTMEFKYVYDKAIGRGLATLIIITAEKIYLETEQVQGAPNRYIGFLKRGVISR